MQRSRDSGRPRLDRQLVEDVLDVLVHGARGSADGLADLRIGFTLGNTAQNLENAYTGEFFTINGGFTSAGGTPLNGSDQVGIAGSTEVGDGAILAGQVGLAEKVVIGPGVIVGAQGGVPTGKKLSGPGEVFWGTPARPIREYLKDLAALARIRRRD